MASIPVSILKDELISVCGSEYVSTAIEDLRECGRDPILNLDFPCDVVVRPGSTEQVSAILMLCNKHKVPVTSRGGATGVTGGRLPVEGGVVLSLERLNRILEINTTDRYVVAEAGVVTEDLCRAVERHGLFFPVIPGSKSSCFVGGNVSLNSGCIGSCKYGNISRYVLNLQVVLADGQLLWTSANVRKKSISMDLTQLFIGSEGVFGIITKVVLELISRPLHKKYILAGFTSLEDAINCVINIRSSSIMPSAVELMCDNAIRLTKAYLQAPLPLSDDSVVAQLLIGLEEHMPLSLNENYDQLVNVVGRFSTLELHTAETSEGIAQLSVVRSSIGNAMVKFHDGYRDIDPSVPLSKLADYLFHIKKVCGRFSIPFVSFGHAFDGNVHTMLLFDKDNGYDGRISEAADLIYQFALQSGGAISGEHGIGLLQKKYMPMQFGASHLSILRNIKNIMDPNSILNVGKIF